MIEQIGVDLPFTVFYSVAGYRKTGLAVTVDVYRNGVKIVAAAAATEFGDGLYGYTLSSAFNTVAGVYVAIFNTTDATVDSRDLVTAWYVNPGQGAIATTVTITVSGIPQDGVEVWLTTDVAGTNVVATGVTDAFGNIIFYLNSGTYYVWKQLAGVTFTNPETMVV